MADGLDVLQNLSGGVLAEEIVPRAPAGGRSCRNAGIHLPPSLRGPFLQKRDRVRSSAQDQHLRTDRLPRFERDAVEVAAGRDSPAIRAHPDLRQLVAHGHETDQQCPALLLSLPPTRQNGEPLGGDHPIVVRAPVRQMHRPVGRPGWVKSLLIAERADARGRPGVPAVPIDRPVSRRRAQVGQRGGQDVDRIKMGHRVAPVGNPDPHTVALALGLPAPGGLEATGHGWASRVGDPQRVLGIADAEADDGETLLDGGSIGPGGPRFLRIGLQRAVSAHAPLLGLHYSTARRLKKCTGRLLSVP